MLLRMPLFFRRTILFSLFISIFVLSSCSKEFNAELYIGDYTFTTTGSFKAYEVVVTEGITHPSGENETFCVKPVSGTAKIFRTIGEAENMVHILVTLTSGESLILDGIVGKSNSLEILTYTRLLEVYRESSEETVYEGNIPLGGIGGIVDGVLSVRLTLRSTFEAENKTYGFSSSNIMVVAVKQ